jgi:hypothetical protein
LLSIVTLLGTVVSSLLLMATVALWVRSYRVIDDVGFVRVRWRDAMRREQWDIGARSVKGKWMFWSLETRYHYLYGWEGVARMADPRGDFASDDARRGWYRAEYDVPGGPVRVDVVSSSTVGFAAEHRRLMTRSRDDHYRLLSVPAALPFALFALLPGVRVFRWWRRKRRRGAGHCPTCGYDLRATPGRCPECGAQDAVPDAT